MNSTLKRVFASIVLAQMGFQTVSAFDSNVVGLLDPQCGIIEAPQVVEVITPVATKVVTEVAPAAKEVTNVVTQPGFMGRLVSYVPSKDAALAYIPSKETVLSYVPSKETVTSYIPSKDAVLAYVPSKETVMSCVPSKDAVVSQLTLQNGKYAAAGVVALAGLYACYRGVKAYTGYKIGKNLNFLGFLGSNKKDETNPVVIKVDLKVQVLKALENNDQALALSLVKDNGILTGLVNRYFRFANHKPTQVQILSGIELQLNKLV